MEALLQSEPSTMAIKSAFLFRLIWLLFEQIDTYQFGWMKIVKKSIRIFGFNSSKFL